MTAYLDTGDLTTNTKEIFTSFLKPYLIINNLCTPSITTACKNEVDNLECINAADIATYTTWLDPIKRNEILDDEERTKGQMCYTCSLFLVMKKYEDWIDES